MSMVAAIASTDTILEEIQRALDKFQDLWVPQVIVSFERGHNHPINLQEGSDLISWKSYNYSAAQHDIMEKLVEEFL